MPASYSALEKALGEHAESALHLPLCVTCSTQTSYQGADLSLTDKDSAHKCEICLDPRQFIGLDGQKWTTLAKLHAEEPQHANEFEELISGQVWTMVSAFD